MTGGLNVYIFSYSTYIAATTAYLLIWSVERCNFRCDELHEHKTALESQYGVSTE